jgi:Fungal specific transcription factor domain
MGIHQQRNTQPGLEPWQQEERRNVFWALYILDTTTSFAREKPKYLPMADCDVDLPLFKADDTFTQEVFIPKIRLAQRQEKIYEAMYSTKASRCSLSRRNKKFSHLVASLEELDKSFPCISIHDTRDGNVSHIQRELEFGFRTTRILLYRSKSENHKAKECLEDSIKCLKIFMDLKAEKCHIGAYSVLLRYVLWFALLNSCSTFQKQTETHTAPSEAYRDSADLDHRLFENYPFVAFFHLFSHVMLESSTAEELKLLSEVVEGLRYLQSQKSASARSCSPLPVACALMDMIGKIKPSSSDYQELFQDFSNIGDVNSEFSKLSENRMRFLTFSRCIWP